MARQLNTEEVAHLKLAREMEALVALAPFKVYEALLKAHLTSKTADSMKVVASVDEAMRQNADKGAVLALRLALELPQSIIADAKRLRQESGNSGED